MREITQQDLEVIAQPSRILYSKIYLLNREFQIIDDIQGNLIDGYVTIDSESDIRRTCSLTIHVENSSFLVGEETRIWLDKYLQVFLGLLHERSGDIVWYPLGIYLMNDNLYSYEPSSHTLSLSCVDLMAGLTGLRNGQLPGTATRIPQGSKIRDVLISTVSQLGGIQNYLIEDINEEIPYDLNFSTGSTVYEILSKIAELYPGWELFFDVDGTFIYQPIPTCQDDPISFDMETIRPLILSESLQNSFSEVKNVTEVWGKSISAQRFADSSMLESMAYKIVLDEFELYSTMTIGFKVDSTNPVDVCLKINDLEPYPIVNGNDEPIPENTFQPGKSYIVRYSREKFYYLGQFQIHAINKEVATAPTEEERKNDREKNNCDVITYTIAPDSPYCVEKIGEIRNVLSGGEYEKIYSDDLARQRAEYENWKTTRLQDSFSFEAMLVPWMDVNQKIEMSPVSSLDGVTQFITKNLNISLKTGRMSVQAIKFYPMYPDEGASPDTGGDKVLINGTDSLTVNKTDILLI